MDWDKLPGRAPSPIKPTDSAALTGKRVLVTGAAGYIGSALARGICRCYPAGLVLLDLSEQGIYELQRDFPDRESRVTTILGDVCNASMLEEVFTTYRPQVVFHAAAFKHVPLLEQNPFAAISNNAIGTATLARAAAMNGCEQFILVSTDKAADPLSIMGASKRIAEMTVLASAVPHMRTKAVRLGNVLDSPGSVVPLFREQIKAGGPITVTHRGARRYFMTVEEVTTALLEAATSDDKDAILVPQMSLPVSLTDLAEFMLAALQPPSKPRPEVIFSGLRPGEKLEEVLISSSESWADSPGAQEKKLRRVISPSIAMPALRDAVFHLEQAVEHRDSGLLLRTLAILVPEYQPGYLMTARMHSASSGVSR